MGRLVVREDLVDAEDDVGEHEGRFDGVATAGADPPCAEEYRNCYGAAKEDGIEIVDILELKPAPQEVKRARYHGGGKDKKANLEAVSERTCSLRGVNQGQEKRD